MSAHHHGHSHNHGDWDDHAHDYNAMIDAMEPELSKATNAMLAAIQIQPGMRVLDVACGPGHTAAAAYAAGAKATGLDASPAMIAIAKGRFSGPCFVEGDMLLPPTGPWDAVICRMGGHHVDPSWLQAAFNVLCSGGRLAIAETDALDEEAIANGMRSPSEWKRLIEDAGFTHVSVIESGANMSNLAPEILAEMVGEDAHEHGGYPKGPIYIIAGVKPADEETSSRAN